MVVPIPANLKPETWTSKFKTSEPNLNFWTINTVIEQVRKFPSQVGVAPVPTRTCSNTRQSLVGLAEIEITV